MIISTVSLKGGSGKTTAAVNLAVYFSDLGYSVLLIDADQNGNALKWSGIRDKEKCKVVTVALPSAAALRNNISELSKKADYVIIDGTPALNEISATIMLLSDVSIFPLQASPLDLWAFNDKFLPKYNEVKLIKPSLQGYILLNNIDGRTKLSDEVTEFVNSYEIPVFKNHIADRTIYRDSIAYGLSVLECPNVKAAKEIENLGHELLIILNKIEK